MKCSGGSQIIKLTFGYGPRNSVGMAYEILFSVFQNMGGWYCKEPFPVFLVLAETPPHSLQCLWLLPFSIHSLRTRSSSHCKQGAGFQIPKRMNEVWLLLPRKKWVMQANAMHVSSKDNQVSLQWKRKRELVLASKWRNPQSVRQQHSE